MFAAGILPGFQRSTDFLFESARLAAAPADANLTPPLEGNEGRSSARAYFREVAAPKLEALVSDGVGGMRRGQTDSQKIADRSYPELKKISAWRQYLLGDTMLLMPLQKNG